MAAQSLEYVRKFRPHRRRIILEPRFSHSDQSWSILRPKTRFPLDFRAFWAENSPNIARGRAYFLISGLEPASAIDPRDLLKLYLYGYLQQIRSSRRLEAECGRNLEVMWLLAAGS
jgi:hypothetical protein